MRKMKREGAGKTGRLAGAMAVALTAASVLSACGGEDGQQNDKSVQGSSQTESESSGSQAVGNAGSEGTETVSMTEIHIVGRQLGVAQHPDNAIWQVLDRKMQDIGIKVNMEFYPSTDYVTQGAALIAGGEYPDMMEWWNASYPQDLEDLSNDGVIRPLDDLIEQYGPNIQKVRDEKNSTIYRNKTDGKIYGVPCRSQDLGNNHCYVIRKDWLDAVGMDVPDSLDDLYEVLKAFQNYDADGDGDTSDTVPLGLGNTSHFYMPIDLAMSAYGITYNQWNLNEEGKLEYYAVMDKAKDAIAWVRKLYQEGLMETEYVLLDRDQVWDNMANGKYGMCAYYIDRLDPNTSATGAAFREKNPDAELVMLNVFPDENGNRYYPRMVNTQQMIIFSDASEEAAIACIKYLDYLYTDEGGDLADMGIEGEHWKKNDDGSKEFLVDTEQLNEIGYSMYNWMAKRSNLSPVTNNESREAAATMLDATVDNPVLGIITEAGANYSSALGSLVETSVTSMITDKDIDLDAEFQKFVDTWYGSGGQEWTDEINEAYVNQ